jgi:hypothetical protein
MSQEKDTEFGKDMWRTHMETLMVRMRRIEIAEVIDEAIWKWYFEHGKEVPNWKMQKDPQWWIDYLEELDNQ